MRLWQARLEDEDRLALRVFGAITQPGVQEMGLVPVVFEAFGLTLTRPEALGLVSRLSELYAHAASRTAAQTAIHEDS